MQVAPNQISPGEPFDVFYYLRNPFDGGTYYVRAKIYDVRTGELLSTVALDQSPTNARLFIKTVQAPPDPSGYGRNIVAIASVYTDSGFTTQAESYEEQEQYYLIKSVAPALGGGGGVDYRALREMVDEVVKKRLDSLPRPPVAPAPAPAPEFPSEAFFGAIGALQREVNRVPKEFDTSALYERLGAIQEAISAIPQPAAPDLSPIVDAVNSALFEIEQLKDFMRQVGSAIGSANERAIKEMADKVGSDMAAGLKELMSRQRISIPLVAHLPDKPEAAASPADVNHLM
jgi:hypothetical protein